MGVFLPQWVFSCPNATRGTREDELCPSPDLFSQRYWRGGLLFRSGTSVFTALPPGLRASESVCCAVVGCFHSSTAWPAGVCARASHAVGCFHDGSGATGSVFAAYRIFTAIPHFASVITLAK